MNKERIQKQLIIDSRNWKHHHCFICGNDITRSDINGLNFEVIDNHYIHTTCILKHAPEV